MLLEIHSEKAWNPTTRHHPQTPVAIRSRRESDCLVLAQAIQAVQGVENIVIRRCTISRLARLRRAEDRDAPVPQPRGLYRASWRDDPMPFARPTSRHRLGPERVGGAADRAGIGSSAPGLAGGSAKGRSSAWRGSIRDPGGHRGSHLGADEPPWSLRPARRGSPRIHGSARALAWRSVDPRGPR